MFNSVRSKLRQKSAIARIRRLFRVKDMLEMINFSKPYRRQTNSATRPRHCHNHRPAGSKLMKKYHRKAWDRRYKNIDW